MSQTKIPSPSQRNGKGEVKVAVLMGGHSAERDVSLATGRQILNALDPEKYTVYAIDTASGERLLPGVGDASEFAAPGHPVALLRRGDSTPVTALSDLPQIAKSDRPDVVIIALHGPGGEDGTVQGFLEVLGIPYTGSGVLASALAMDKVRCKMILSTENIIMPTDIVYDRDDAPRLRRAPLDVGRQLGYPVVVKPSRQGSTYGTTLVSDAESLREALDFAFEYDSVALVEERIVGTEITVAVLGNNNLIALPIVEIIPPGGFFDYQAKYSESGAQEIVPARISDELAEEAREIALRCHQLLGCRGMSRTDMFATEDGIVTLEVNTIPGMTPTSLLPKAALAAGISFPALLDNLIALALEKPR